MPRFWKPAELPITEVFIETGTNRGDSLAVALGLGYPLCMSVEFVESLYHTALQRFAAEPRARLFQGSSPDVLPAVIDPDKSTTFWLDAHYSGSDQSWQDPRFGECPLLQELDVILRTPWRQPPIILIDDAFVFNADYWAAPSAVFEPAKFTRSHWPTFADIERILAGFEIREENHALICLRKPVLPQITLPSLFLAQLRSIDLYRALCHCLSSSEPNLLERTENQTAEAQIEFLRWAIAKAAPRRLLESGTNKGMFGLLLSLIAPGVELYTMDSDARARRAADLLQTGQNGVRVSFYEGDSRTILSQTKFDAQLAWIDAGKGVDVVSSDILNCSQLRVPFIALADTTHDSVQQALGYVLERTPYRVIGNPFMDYDRRRALLLGL